MIPIEDTEDLNFRHLDGKAFDDRLSGMKITGAEPIDYPNTDGIIIYLQSPGRQKYVLVVEQDPFGADVFDTKIAKMDGGANE